MSNGESTETLPRLLASDFETLRHEVRALASRARAVFVKSLFHGSLMALYTIRRALPGAGERELHFYPQIPHAEYTVWKLCAMLGVRKHRLGARGTTARGKTVFVFDDNDLEPERVPNPGPVIDAAPACTINLRCTDISKSAVSQAFEETFGYGIEVDPTTHQGPIVEKSDANARHDGRVIEAPVAQLDPDCVYQHVIDNAHPGGLVEDIRVPVVGASVPFVYLKYRPLESRFSNENSFVLLRERRDVLSDGEVERILSVCASLGLDCGEIDAVRDRTTSRLYVLDVNKTCYGPPNHLRLLDCYRAIWRLARAFEANFLSSDGAQPFIRSSAFSRISTNRSRFRLRVRHSTVRTDL